MISAIPVRSPHPAPPAPSITPSLVAQALRHIRDLQALSASPLCRLASIRQMAPGGAQVGRPGDEGDDGAGAWPASTPGGDAPAVATPAVATPADATLAVAALTLADHLRTTVADALGAHRGAAVPPFPQGRSALEDGLLADFGAGNAEREAWSVLHHRFTAPSRLPAKRIERMGGWSRRTILRRANLGFTLLAEALGDAERRSAIAALSAVRSDAAPDRPAAPASSASSASSAAPTPGHLPLAWQRASTVLEMSTAGPAAGRRMPDRAALRAIAASMLIDHLESALGEAWRGTP